MSEEDIARDFHDDPGPVCGSGPLPLEGIRVLDLNSGAAPHCGQFLAVFGAEVVLVEPESAEASRSDLAWAAFNAGKKSVALDVSTSEGRLRLDELVGTCDVVIDSDRTGNSDFDPRAGNPSLIHITVSDFGLSGPRAGWTASELVAQAAGGLLYLSGDSDHPPAEVGFPVATSVSGGQAACAVLIALAQRRRTGEGARIDLSRQESVANLQFTNHFTARAFGLRGSRGDAPLTTEKGQIKRRTIWDCADGTLTWNLWTGRGWGRKNIPFFEWLRDEDVPEAAALLARDWDHMDRSELTPELLEQVHRVVGDFFKRTSKATAKREALARKLLLYVIQDMEDVATDEQLLERRAFRELDLPGGKTVPSVGTPVRSSAYKLEMSRHVPAYGEHTQAILEEWRANPPTPTGGSEGRGSGRLPLEGLKVLDFCWLVVGPLTTKYLSMFGADVARDRVPGSPLRRAPDRALPQGQAEHERRNDVRQHQHGQAQRGSGHGPPPGARRALPHGRAGGLDHRELHARGHAARGAHLRGIPQGPARHDHAEPLDAGPDGEARRAARPGKSSASSGAGSTTSPDIPRACPRVPAASCRTFWGRGSRSQPCWPRSSTGTGPARASTSTSPSTRRS